MAYNANSDLNPIYTVANVQNKKTIHVYGTNIHSGVCDDVFYKSVYFIDAVCMGENWWIGRQGIGIQCACWVVLVFKVVFVLVASKFV